MFLPTDLTTGEADLVATVTRQLLERRRPATPDEEASVRMEARQVAAEMVLAQRAELTEPEPEDDEPESEYLRFRRELIERERKLLDEEAAEIEADRLG